MMKVLLTVLRIPDLRKKIMFTLLMIIVFRIGAHITVPGINFQVLEDYFKQAAGGAKGLTDYIDLFAGGAFKRLSLFALGIMPYISASIIMQLLMVVVPNLQRLAKEGEYGRRKINQYTRYGTVVLCALQSYGITVYISSLNVQMPGIIEGGDSLGFVLLTILTITTGTIFLMWLGELMTERGIGNGVSLLIFAGIISGAPSAVATFWADVQNPTGTLDMLLVLILIVIFVIMIGLSIILSEGQRKIPLNYGKKIVGRKIYQGTSQVLPIKVNAANVMPIIFASSLLLFPSQIASYLEGSYPGFSAAIQAYLAPGSLVQMFLYIVLIVFFAYFYTAIQYNPKDLAEALKKNGGFIPGVRPGSETEEYIEYVLNRITLAGALFLAFIAIAPDLIINIWDLQKYSNMAYLFGGTSLLITVGVTLDTLKQIHSQLVMRNYEGFLDKSRRSPIKARVGIVR
ncbi:MAG: preprotein translocase subunit SecY [Leptospiraceae bacterium]|nr:preprotein translocase subunit SecY [Leptospiraceae bacterium]MDW8306063.1 preprotein translocase subunit SecY [Leptospiraceae bacterium]